MVSPARKARQPMRGSCGQAIPAQQPEREYPMCLHDTPARVHGIIFVDMVPTPPCRVLRSRQPFQVAAWRGRSVLRVHNAENGSLSRRAARVRERVGHEQASTKTHYA